jgi:transglutaminase/protease-like cytokinesis protein 3
MKTKLYIYFSTLFFTFSYTSFGQSQDYTIVDKYINQIPSDFNSIEELIHSIIKPEWKDEEKIRAIYYWIAFNIRYDWEEYQNETNKNYLIDPTSANDIFKSRKGLCNGFTALFNYMCKLAGIESKIIKGYSRSSYNEAGIPINVPNHAWNVVSINKRWYFIDVTWGSSSALNNEPNDYYFLTPPKEFIVNHFPEDEEWQLLEKPISKEEFDQYPYISFEYFKLGFDRNFPKKGLIKSNNDAIKLLIENPANLELLLKLFDFTKKKWITPIYKAAKLERGSKISISLKHKGKYLLQIDAMNQSSESISVKQGLLYFSLIKE